MLTGWVPKAKKEAKKKVIEKFIPPVLRPPGAIAPLAFLDKCTRCGDCSNACPFYAIYTLADDAPVGKGSPILLPGQAPCHMCEGFPCASACATGALVKPEETTVMLGKVNLIEENCFAFRGPECGACGGLCPGGIKAITFRMARPQLDVESCIGCGLCIEACPTTPKAFVFIPAYELAVEA